MRKPKRPRRPRHPPTPTRGSRVRGLLAPRPDTNRHTNNLDAGVRNIARRFISRVPAYATFTRAEQNALVKRRRFQRKAKRAALMTMLVDERDPGTRNTRNKACLTLALSRINAGSGGQRKRRQEEKKKIQSHYTELRRRCR